jgi:hypothetical protein
MTPVGWVPHSAASAAVPAIAGTPALGAQVTASDGLSDSTVTLAVGSPPVASFTLVGVATGTWSVLVSSNQLVMQVATVTIASQGSVAYISSATTVPAWTVAGYNNVFLSSTATGGYVSGRVYNYTGSPLASIPVGNGVDPSKVSGANGVYFFPCSTGTWDITANISGFPSPNASYVSRSSPSIPVTLGDVYGGVDFFLNQGGRVTGKVTRDGVNAVPGIALVAVNSGGVGVDQQVTDTTGRFTFVDLTTGSYTISAVLDSGETSTPVSVTTNVAAGATADIGTFTVVGAFGRITGTATYGGVPIQTGVLIVASTAAVSAPPALSAATLSGTPYYIGQTREDGTYTIDIRGSTNPAYNLGAYYFSFATSVSTVPVISTKTYTNVQVYPGSTTASINFSFP